MDKFEDLVGKVEKIIEEEKAKNPDIKYLEKEHARLIAQIISNFRLEKNNAGEKPEASMLFIGAPTGAGKDTLVRKVVQENPDKNYVVLNMDMFRYYHNAIDDGDNKISDKDFALKTNQTSYEIYYIIQEIILREFPGTNVIITGTMKDLDWVKEIVEQYKKDKNTKYTTSLLTLAVPVNESAFSIFERYLNLVDTRDDSDIPLRYTDLRYHNDTVKDFISNVEFFEGDMKTRDQNGMFSSVKVFKRNSNIFDLSEDTLIYDSENPQEGKDAVTTIREVMGNKVPIETNRAIHLLNIIKNNAGYLKQQGLYQEILVELKAILPQANRMPEIEETEIS